MGMLGSGSGAPSTLRSSLPTSSDPSVHHAEPTAPNLRQPTTSSGINWDWAEMSDSSFANLCIFHIPDKAVDDKVIWLRS